MVVLSDLNFKESLGEAYYRNNRTSGQKSFRCFPHCCEKGHIVSGFCGSHLEATAVIQKAPTFGLDWQNKEILIIAEIRPSLEPRISGFDTVSKNKILTDLRDMKNPRSGGELVSGKIEILREDDHNAWIKIVFNGEKHSWDYSWKGNRWTPTTHVVDVLLIQSFESAVDSNDLIVYSSACSDPFGLISSHKSTIKIKTEKKKKKSNVPRLGDAELSDNEDDDDKVDTNYVKRTYNTKKKILIAELEAANCLVKSSCYVYDIQRNAEMETLASVAAASAPFINSGIDIIDRIIHLPSYYGSP